MRLGRRGAALAWGALAFACCAPVRAARAQDLICDERDVEVASLGFTGNRAFSDAALARAIATTASSRAHRLTRIFGTRRCLDRAEFPLDRLRLIIFYRNHGFPHVAVDTLVREAGLGRVDVRFIIAEGRPLFVDSLRITGLSGIADSARIARNLPVRLGGRFEKPALDAARDTIARRLRNAGYPNAEVLRSFETDTQRMGAAVQLDVAPGPLTRIGDVRIEIAPAEGRTRQIEPAVVRSVLGVRSGAIYRERELVNAQRSLYQTDAFPHVKITLDTARTPTDSLVDLVVELTEGRMHLARLGAGYGTLDCGRANGEFTDRNAFEWLTFPAGIRRLEVTARLSKIGIGEPLDGAKNLCPQIRTDPYSSKLNYFGSATIRQPVIFGLRTVPSLTVYSERRSEYKAYLRTTPIGGVTSLTYQRNPRLPMTLAYQLEYGRTDATAALFCAVFNICERAARENLQRTQRQAVASLGVVRDRTDRALSPSRGTLLRADARHASQLILSNPDAEFNQFTGDARFYHRLGDGIVLAGRVRAGAVFGRRLSLRDAGEFIPPQERLYAGGETTVRGFRQNELGPIIYLATDIVRVDSTVGGVPVTYVRAASDQQRRAIPAGGNSVIVGNLELRMRSPIFSQVLQFTTFADVGEVWNRGADDLNLNFRQLKWTPGAGVRIFSPVGAIRVDLGYNPYQRQPGPAYYDQPLAEGGALYCVSPTNTLPLRTDGTQEEGPCPGTFRPPPRTRFIQRINLNFSIGQAF